MNWKERWTASNVCLLVFCELSERIHPLCSDFKFFRMVVLFGVKNPDLSAAIGSTQNCGSCHQLFKLKRQASSRSSTSLSKTFSPSHQTYPKCWWPLWWMICMCYILSLIIVLWTKFVYVASLRICCGQPKYAKVLFPRPPSDAFRLLKRPEAFVFGNIRKWIGYKWFSNVLVFPIFDTIYCEDFYHRRKCGVEFNTVINDIDSIFSKRWVSIWSPGHQQGGGILGGPWY